MKLSAESEHGPAPTFSWRRAPDRGEVAPPIAAKSRRKTGAILSLDSGLKNGPAFRRDILIIMMRRKTGAILSPDSGLKIGTANLRIRRQILATPVQKNLL